MTLMLLITPPLGVGDFPMVGPPSSAVTEAMKKLRHRLLLVQLTRPSDLDPTLQGDLRLRDCESGEVQEVTVNAGLLARYRKAVETFQNGLQVFARKREAGLIRLNTEEEVVPQIARLFESGRWEL